MAVIHPEDRVSGLDRSPYERPHKMHPAIGLAMGFGFIFAVAAVVHILFTAL
ncbi:hypothetical protein [Brevundimonas sp.]|jgi:hypothetical protein|uniref:hypothetical protein n=1 Tax=Brevundimonas sp. TaxID=1871086 RepID=UPI001A2DE471|nr:hypothetical protein [Brevundimonas sp.]MBJ7511315.1 hypothetical protein [Brevundimonas sp.]